MPKSAVSEVTLLICLQNTSPATSDIAWEGYPLKKETSEQTQGAFLSAHWLLFIFSSYVLAGIFPTSCRLYAVAVVLNADEALRNTTSSNAVLLIAA